ncbi:MAG: hypothetical protein CSB06_00445 [Bacteroidia bacterium]|nr:MAG: hypothetical protein CSB06_00445 [Bacteroidia bacterium]
MTPKKTLLFILSVLFTLLLLSIIFPKDGITLFNGKKWQFITFEEILSPPKQTKKDIDSLLSHTTIDEEPDDTLAFVQEQKKEKRDSVLIDSQYVYYKPMPVKIDSVVRYLEFPTSAKTDLDPFFALLKNIKNDRKKIRIMHYGDSQIETDRITDYFRYKLQKQFGGTGCGLVPAVKAFNFKSPMIHTTKGQWKRYTVYGRRHPAVTHNRYGVTGNFSRFSPILPPTDTLDSFAVNKDLTPYELNHYASLTIAQSPYSFQPTKRYSKCKLFYGNCPKKVKVKLYADESLKDSVELQPTNNYKTHTWTFARTPGNLKFEFEAPESPDIYGFSLEGNSGINIDNIAMRGAAGLFFSRMNGRMLAQMYKELNVKMFILQFGGNTVPGMRDNYAFYQKGFSRQIKRLKKLVPDAVIIVIGLADMSMKEKDIYVSYPNIPKIRDALKQAAFANQCVYWDMYEAMGGKNSMPSWVFHDPPLGEKDFTHFTPKGARYIAKMFYNAFMYEYNRYLRKNP